jgi:excisionase family DNA binding protein
MKTKKEKIINKVYTTREVGRFCGVDLTTVINWVKNGRLKAYKTAGGHRRIKHQDLIDFMHKYSMPVPIDLRSKESLNILLVNDDPKVKGLVSDALEQLHIKYKTTSTKDNFEIGYKLATFRPDIIVVDVELRLIDGLKLIEKIRRYEKEEKIIALTSASAQDMKTRVKVAGADIIMSKPFKEDDFIEIITGL